MKHIDGITTLEDKRRPESFKAFSALFLNKCVGLGDEGVIRRVGMG